MGSIDAANRLPAPPVRASVLEGDITQIHRGDEHAAVGDTFEIEGTTFEVVNVTERRLGDMTDDDARAEGSPDLEADRRRIEQTRDLEWDDDSTAVRHRFEPVSA